MGWWSGWLAGNGIYTRGRCYIPCFHSPYGTYKAIVEPSVGTSKQNKLQDETCRAGDGPHADSLYQTELESVLTFFVGTEIWNQNLLKLVHTNMRKKHKTGTRGERNSEWKKNICLSLFDHKLSHQAGRWWTNMIDSSSSVFFSKVPQHLRNLSPFPDVGGREKERSKHHQQFWRDKQDLHFNFCIVSGWGEWRRRAGEECEEGGSPLTGVSGQWGSRPRPRSPGSSPPAATSWNSLETSCSLLPRPAQRFRQSVPDRHAKKRERERELVIFWWTGLLLTMWDVFKCITTHRHSLKLLTTSWLTESGGFPSAKVSG